MYIHGVIKIIWITNITSVTGEYIILDDVYVCSINDAQCVHIDSFCVCHCMPGYILEDEKCLKSKILFFPPISYSKDHSLVIVPYAVLKISRKQTHFVCGYWKC